MEMRNVILESYRKMQEMSPEFSDNQDRDEKVGQELADPKDMQSPSDTVDTLTLDVPLMIRMVEMGREELADDETLHRVIENLVQASNDKQGEALTMDDYDAIVQGETQNFKQEPEAVEPEEQEEQEAVGYSNY